MSDRLTDERWWDRNEPDPRALLAGLWEAVYGEPLTARPEPPSAIWRQCIGAVEGLRQEWNEAQGHAVRVDEENRRLREALAMRRRELQYVMAWLDGMTLERLRADPEGARIYRQATATKATDDGAEEPEPST